MKILHIVRQFYPCVGGVENFVFCLAREQLKAGNKVAVLTLNKNFYNKKALSCEEMYEGIEIKRIPFWGSRRYPIAVSCVRYLNDYDVINIHCVDFFVDYLVFLKFLHKKKIILHTHGGYFHTRWLASIKKLYFNTISRLVLLGCDRVIAVSRHDFELFSKISDNLVRIDNGVDVEQFGAIYKDIEWGYLLYIGRIDEHKGLDNLINVLSILIKRGFKVRLKIIGPDWKGLRSHLEALADRLGIKDSVIFMGQLADEGLVKEISRAHIFVSASQYEAFGISAVEAMASGTPCVLNNIDSFKQFLDGGNRGFLTDFNDYEKSAKCITKILEMNRDSYNTMGLNAKEGTSQYSWHKVNKEVMKVYEKVLKK